MIDFQARVRKGNEKGVLEITIPKPEANKEGLLEGDIVLVWIKSKLETKPIIDEVKE